MPLGKQLISKPVSDMISDYDGIVYSKFIAPRNRSIVLFVIPQGRKPAGATAALVADVTAIMLIAFRHKIYEEND